MDHFWGTRSNSFPHPPLHAELIQADLQASDLCPDLALERIFAEPIAFGQGHYIKSYAFRENLTREEEMSAGSEFGTGSGVSSGEILCLSLVTSSHGLPVLFLPLKTKWLLLLLLSR